MDEHALFDSFKSLCAAESLLQDNITSNDDDITSGISDDGTLFRFLRAREFDVEAAFRQYKATRKWRDTNRILELYESIEVSDFEETRKMYTHWTGRRARDGSPLFIFEIQKLTPSVMAAYNDSCSSRTPLPGQTESEAMLRLFCTYEHLIRFLLPYCSAVHSRPEPEKPITNTTCIVDISGVSLLQFWRLKSHMQAASTLATLHYPETLGRTYIIGAPYFFPTIWSWISKWFSANTVSKIRIVPQGHEYAMLSEIVDPGSIPHKYGGHLPFDFGMLPDLDPEMKDMVEWLDEGTSNLPMGPLRWVRPEGGVEKVVAVGMNGEHKRHTVVMALRGERSIIRK